MPLPRIFDAVLARQRQQRATRGVPADFLLARTVDDIVERLAVVQRRFTDIADVATPSSKLGDALARAYPNASLRHVEPRNGIVSNAAETLPLAPASLDLVTSCLALQAVNDLPGALLQIRLALKSDGLFIGALAGGRTLHELRAVLTEAETNICGGASPRVAPFADVREMGGLLQRAGFALPVADCETVTVRYATMFALMADLRAMGATNVLVSRSRRPAPRSLFLDASRLYAERYADPDGRIRATFDIVSLSGWAPHPSQTQPAQRGSATMSLAAALNAASPKRD